MKTSRICIGCTKRFTVDNRNDRHHSYCSDLNCQRLRRAQAQKRRRTQQATGASCGVAGAGTELQADVKPTEADWPAAYPMFIGLISMITGLTDLEDIKAVCRNLHERGANILGPGIGRELKSLHE